MLCTVITSSRTVLLDESMSIKDVIEILNGMGLKFSIRRTLQFYGLRYVEDRSFISKYKAVFGLNEEKTMYDITLKELMKYRSLLIGYSVRDNRN